MKSVRWILLAAAVIFIAAATLTPGTDIFPGGLRPDFWCMACGVTGGADFAVNVTLFVPLGIALGMLLCGSFRETLAKPTFIGFAFSVAIELAQRAGIPPSRVFNATDILSNTFGTLVGAFIVATSAQWISPSRRLAMRLAVCGLAGITLFLALTAWALSPLVQPDSTMPLRTSRMSFTPGYGWYHGRVQRVSFGQRSVQHTGDGPVILTGSITRAQQLSVELTGRDERDSFVPFVYVHDDNGSEPSLMLGQEGASAKFLLRLRGSKLRLPGPSLFVRDAFKPESISNAFTIVAKSSPSQWELTVDDGRSRRANTLRLSLAVGWSLLQTVVSLESPAAPFISAAWMFVPWIVIGYWCLIAAVRREGELVRGGHNSDTRWPRESGMALVGVVGFVAIPVTLLAIPRIMGIADTSFAELLLAVSGYVTGITFAWFALRNTRRFDAPIAGHAQANPLQ